MDKRNKEILWETKYSLRTQDVIDAVKTIYNKRCPQDNTRGKGCAFLSGIFLSANLVLFLLVYFFIGDNLIVSMIGGNIILFLAGALILWFYIARGRRKSEQEDEKNKELFNIEEEHTLSLRSDGLNYAGSKESMLYPWEPMKHYFVSEGWLFITTKPEKSDIIISIRLSHLSEREISDLEDVLDLRVNRVIPREDEDVN